MKEFRTKIGGRKIYNEDFYYLQEIATSVLAFFNDCGLNYVITGCEVSDDSISEGYVFLEGQVRKVEKTAIANLQRPVITPVTQAISQQYEDGNVSPIGIVYGTKVIPANEFLTGVGISSVYNETTGKYEFLRIVDTFWNHYTLVKNGSKSQDVNVLTKFARTLKMLNISLQSQNLSAKIDKNSIRFYNTGNIVSYISTDTDGCFSFCDGDGNVLFKLNGKDDISSETIKNITAKTLETQTVTAGKLTINNTDIKDVFYTSEEYADTGWYNLLYVNTGEEIPNLFARSYLGMVHIQGTLPTDFFMNLEYGKVALPFSSGYSRTQYLLNVKLPDEIPAPSGDYVNVFQTITPLYGTVGANVLLDKGTKRFYITDVYGSSLVGGLRPALDSGINLFSFPFWGINGTNGSVSQAISGLKLYDRSDIQKLMAFQDQSVCPSVSWQYSSDVPVSLKTYTYQDEFYIYVYFNPDSDMLHISGTFKRYSYTTDMNTGVETKDLVVSKTMEVEGFELSSEDYNSSCTISGTDYVDYMKDPNVKMYEERRGSKGESNFISDSERWDSYGYKLHDLDKYEQTADRNHSSKKHGIDSHCEDRISIKVKFKDSQYYTEKFQNVSIFNKDRHFSFSVYVHGNWNDNKEYLYDYICINPRVWEYYEYRKKYQNYLGNSYYNYYNIDDSYIRDTVSTTPGDYSEKYGVEITEGSDYIELKEVSSGCFYYGFTEKALNATGTIWITVKMYESANRGTVYKERRFNVYPSALTEYKSPFN